MVVRGLNLIEIYWECKNCGYETREKPPRFISCPTCGKARLRSIIICEICGKHFHPERLARITCSVNCAGILRGSRESKKKGKTYPHIWTHIKCDHCGKTFRQGMRRPSSKYCSHECYMKAKPETPVIKKVIELLDHNHVNYEKEKRIGKYSIDFYIPKHKLCIEIDGTYHLFPSRMVKDSEKNRYLLKNGYSVLRIPHKAILDRFEAYTGESSEKV